MRREGGGGRKREEGGGGGRLGGGGGGSVSESAVFSFRPRDVLHTIWKTLKTSFLIYIQKYLYSKLQFI